MERVLETFLLSSGENEKGHASFFFPSNDKKQTHFKDVLIVNLFVIDLYVTFIFILCCIHAIFNPTKLI